jgi:hypothetical protein
MLGVFTHKSVAHPVIVLVAKNPTDNFMFYVRMKLQFGGLTQRRGWAGVSSDYF